MKTKIINTRKIVAVTAFCCGVAFAQNAANGADWSQGFEGQPPQSAQPAGLTAAEQTAARIAAMTAAAQQSDGQPAAAEAAASEEQPVVSETPAAASEETSADIAQQPKPSQPGIIDAASNMRIGHDLSASALAAAPFLRTKGSTRIGEGRLQRNKDRIMYQLFDRIVVLPTGGKLNVNTGDTVDVFSAGRWMSLEGQTSQIVSRSGRATVVGFAGNRAVIELIEIWRPITGGESIAKRAEFEPFFCDKLELIDPRVGAKILFRVEDSVAPYLQQYLIINKGTAAGIKLGDFFRVTERRRVNHFSENVLEAQVVHVAANSATLIVKKLYRDNVEVGDEAFSTYRTVARR